MTEDSNANNKKMKNDIYIAIDAGSYSAKIAGENKFIASVPGRDLLKIREESEIFFDEPIFSCVAALPGDFDRRQRENFIFEAKRAGFKNIEIISSHDAMLSGLDDKDREQTILIYDFGFSKSEIIFFDGGEIIDSEIIKDVSGETFDKIFASWLSERFTLNLINEKELLTRAENFKRELSSKDSMTWRGVEIGREDFERLIYFSVRRASHTAERFVNCYDPDKFIMTGGSCEIPVVKKIFRDLFPKIIFDESLIVSGTAKKATSLSSKREESKKLDNKAKLSEIRGALMTLEDLLTRKQKDRLYGLFRQIETLSENSPALIKLLENLVGEIRSEGSVKDD